MLKELQVKQEILDLQVLKDNLTLEALAPRELKERQGLMDLQDLQVRQDLQVLKELQILIQDR